MHSFARYLLVFAVVAAGSAFGQAIVLKDGNRVFSSEFSINPEAYWMEACNVAWINGFNIFSAIITLSKAFL